METKYLKCNFSGIVAKESDWLDAWIEFRNRFHLNDSAITYKDNMTEVIKNGSHIKTK